MAKKKADQAEIEGARAFGVFMSHVDAGEFQLELGQKQVGLMRTLAQHAGMHKEAKGSITIVFNYVVEDSGLVRVKPDVKVKEPKPHRPSTAFFMEQDGNLSITNTRQGVLFDAGPQAVPSRRDVEAPARASTVTVSSGNREVVLDAAARQNVRAAVASARSQPFDPEPEPEEESDE